ncbi:MAG: type II toxin-antitoxin system Phd/YefM family antitoxin [Cyanobacteria bacterium J06635_15]
MDFLSVRQARDKLYALMDEITENHNPVFIAGKRNEAVLIAKADWDAIQETLYLNNIPGMVESIQNTAQEPLEDCTELKDLDW